MGIDVETCVFAQPEIYISIHAPRMGSDPSSTRAYSTSTNFNPRSPDGERLPASEPIMPLSAFQSTLPGWGATCASAVGRARPCDFNPRSPDGERPGTGSPLTFNGLFQSTLPGWGATHCGIRGCRPVVISIHAPRMGSDWFHVSGVPKMAFQSTLPGWGATVLRS